MRSLIFIMFFISGLVQASPLLTLQRDGQQQQLTLAQLKQQLPVVQVSIDDPVYHVRKQYQAFELKALLQTYGFVLDAQADELVMTALDGYAPPIAVEALQRYPAYLAFAEVGKADFSFAKVQLGKSSESPAPYYLIWQVAPDQVEQLPWPFQVVSIKKVSLAQQYAAMYPTPQASNPQRHAAQRGFQLFRQHCVRCHSINLQGGVVGPELNAPKSVVEYWPEPHLRGLIKDASSYRYRSKMPAFNQLSAQDIDDLLAYFRQMSTQKRTAP